MYTLSPPPIPIEEMDPSLALDTKSQAAQCPGKQSSIFSLPSSPFCWRKARELTGIRGIFSSASDSLPPPSACPFPSWATGSVKQPEELRGELIGGGGRRARAGKTVQIKGVCLPGGLLMGPSHAHNSSSSSPCGKQKRCFNGSVGRGEEREG